MCLLWETGKPGNRPTQTLGPRVGVPLEPAWILGFPVSRVFYLSRVLGFPVEADFYVS